jgi:hypothetical protein
MNPYLIVTLLIASLGSYPAQAKQTASESVPTISYCELLREPALYQGKLVRVAATWNYGFEWSYLYHRQCMSRVNKAWVEFVDEDEGCPQTNKVSKKLKDGFDNKADVIVVGTLSGGGGYGHMNGYQYQFTIKCLEEAKQIPANVP